ncbi:hypothetical protein U27_02526 [Candidatus Vecturithrix granuli]|uniref:OmpA-like domain-containing protein n=1 Tax=Vecturithrix granuli TaxID=1499967 RepID=A0A081CAU2_VECG1|nr:hypothetical protein U27_02526 [Candidatus Vecturithrix granuli]
MNKRLVLISVSFLISWSLTWSWTVTGEELASGSFPNRFGVSGLYSLIGTDTLGDKALSFGLIGDFSEFSLPEDPRTPQLFELGFHAGFSLNQQIEFAVLTPYRRLSVSDEGDLKGFDESGIGDILATAKFRLLDEQEILPALGLYAQLSFPTGDEEKGMGSGSIDATLGGMLTKRLSVLKLYGNVGFLLSGWERGDPNPLFDDYQHSLLYGIGAEFPADNSTFRLFSEFTFLHEFGDEDEDRIVTFLDEEIEDVVDNAGQMSLGVMLNAFDGFAIRGGAAFRIMGEEPVPDAPVWRGFLQLSYIFGRKKASKVEPSEEQTQPVSIERPANRCPEITEVSLSDSSVRGGEQVRIAVMATDPDGDQLYYVWNTSGGTLTGWESQIVWTAPECLTQESATTSYDVIVEVSDRTCTVNRVMTIAVTCGPEGRPGQPAAVILFPSGSTRLNNIAKAQLDNLAPLLKQFPDQTIMLDGHTDATGDETSNQRIGLQRAESVKEYLVQRHEIDPKRITTNSYGSSRPVASNETQEGRNQNRRVEIYRLD